MDEVTLSDSIKGDLLLSHVERMILLLLVILLVALGATASSCDLSDAIFYFELSLHGMLLGQKCLYDEI